MQTRIHGQVSHALSSNIPSSHVRSLPAPTTPEAHVPTGPNPAAKTRRLPHTLGWPALSYIRQHPPIIKHLQRLLLLVYCSKDISPQSAQKGSTQNHRRMPEPLPTYTPPPEETHSLVGQACSVVCPASSGRPQTAAVSAAE